MSICSQARAPAILDRSRELVRPALEEAVSRLGTGLREPVEYHLGWRDESGAAANKPGGKFLRAALAILSAKAAGGDPELALPGAVAVELLHNFSLLHDDVIDHDAKRRHRPTVWALYGVGTAVIAGDALLALAHQTLLEQPGSGARAAARSLAFATTALIAGEAQDMAFEGRDQITLDECVAMSLGKTGALLACAASIGVLLCDGDPSLAETLAEFGLNLGLAFQAVDDILGIWGDPEITGKPAGNDIREAKHTLPLVLALSGTFPERDDLLLILGKARRGEALGDDEISLARSLVERCGGRERAELEASRHLAFALEALDSVGARPDIDPTVLADLAELARFVVNRDA